jgi:hypothetical protein
VLSHRIGLDGIWIAYPVAFISSFAMLTVYYVAVWQKRTHVRLI